jgi:hypothetical protein
MGRTSSTSQPKANPLQPLLNLAEQINADLNAICEEGDVTEWIEITKAITNYLCVSNVEELNGRDAVDRITSSAHRMRTLLTQEQRYCKSLH